MEQPSDNITGWAYFIVSPTRWKLILLFESQLAAYYITQQGSMLEIEKFHPWTEGFSHADSFTLNM